MPISYQGKWTVPCINVSILRCCVYFRFYGKLPEYHLKFLSWSNTNGWVLISTLDCIFSFFVIRCASNCWKSVDWKVSADSLSDSEGCSWCWSLWRRVLDTHSSHAGMLWWEGLGSSLSRPMYLSKVVACISVKSSDNWLWSFFICCNRT